MKREFIAGLLAAALAALNAVPASAKTVPPLPVQPVQRMQQTMTSLPTTVDNGQPYGDPACGVWANGVWQPNGRCPGYVVGTRRARVAGTITAVKGHLVTVQQATQTIVINDQPALNRQTSGRVAVGRQIVAYGYWRGRSFFATAME